VKGVGMAFMGYLGTRADRFAENATGFSRSMSPT